MTNKHRVGKLIAFLVLVAGCGSKETAEPQDKPKAESKDSKTENESKRGSKMESDESDDEVEARIKAKAKERQEEIEREFAKASPRPVPTTKATPEDCVKAKAEVERLERCGGDLEEVLGDWKKMNEALTNPDVPEESKRLILDGCQYIVAQTATLNCDNIKKTKKRKVEADSDD